MSTYTTPTYPSMDTIQPTQQPGFQPYQQIPQTPYMGQIPQTPYMGQIPQAPYMGQMPQVSPFIEQSYIENILRLNRGKVATIYMNFENSQWGSKIFRGVIEAAGKDHIIISDPATNMRYLLLSIYLNYITFDEEINYEYPFAQPNIPNTQFRKKETKDKNKVG